MIPEMACALWRSSFTLRKASDTYHISASAYLRTTNCDGGDTAGTLRTECLAKPCCNTAPSTGWHAPIRWPCSYVEHDMSIVIIFVYVSSSSSSPKKKGATIFPKQQKYISSYSIKKLSKHN